MSIVDHIEYNTLGVKLKYDIIRKSNNILHSRIYPVRIYSKSESIQKDAAKRFSYSVTTVSISYNSAIHLAASIKKPWSFTRSGIKTFTFPSSVLLYRSDESCLMLLQFHLILRNGNWVCILDKTIGEIHIHMKCRRYTIHGGCTQNSTPIPAPLKPWQKP